MAALSYVNVHSAGGIVLGPGIPNYTINGKVVAAVGDKIAPHGSGPHANATIVTGIGYATVYGKVPALSGASVSCGCLLTGDSINVM